MLYWTVPLRDLPAGASELSYQVTHTQALAALPDAALSLRGDSGTLRLVGNLDPGDYGLASALPVDGAENPGSVKLPLDGSQLRQTNQFTLVVETDPASTELPRVNGVPVSAAQLGHVRPSADGQRERRSYYALPVHPGKNLIEFGREQVTLNYAGPTVRYEVTPLSAQADGSTPVRVRIRALDAAGLPAEQPTVTLRTSAEPLRPDARPGEVGYQLELHNGEGVLELRPQITPTALRLELLRDQQVSEFRVDVRPGGAALGVGLVSAAVGLGGTLPLAQRLHVQARAYYEGPLAGGQLYVAADSAGLPREDSGKARGLTYGDSSSEAVPLRGSDPVAALYEHPAFRVAYRDQEVPVNVVPLPGRMTALSASTKGNVRVSGFAALLPGDLVQAQVLRPDGTRLLRLGQEDIAPASETLTVVTRDAQTGTELGRRVLTRGVEYVLDERTGIVSLAQPPDATDAELHRVEVLASYRLSGAAAGRQPAYGAQVEVGDAQRRFGVAAVSLDGRGTIGAAGELRRGGLQVSGRALLSGGVQAEAALDGHWRSSDALSVRAHYQDEAYQGLGKGEAGLRASGRYQVMLGERLGAALDATYQRAPSKQGSDEQDGGGQGEVGALLTYRAQPWTVGGGLRWGFGSRSGLSAAGQLGYEGKQVSLSVTHSQPLSGTVRPTSDFKVAYRLTPHAALALTDHYVWGDAHSAALTLDTRLGNVNYAVAYELPGAGGAGNRARFGVSTSVPLGARTTLGLRGSALYDLQSGGSELGAGADLRWQGERAVATLGGDLAWRSGQLQAVVRGGVSGDLSERLNVSADATAELGARQGLKFGVGYAYRSAGFSSLGYGRYAGGSLGGSRPEASAGVSAEYRQGALTVRGGVDARALLSDPGSLTYQPSLGLRAELNARFSVGGWARALVQPASSQVLPGYGLEAGVQVLPGTWLSAGYNLAGFEGLPSAGLYTRPGAYLRLDVALDEGAGKKTGKAHRR
ncbi:hypothetical protein [Deinococcus radiodurans]|uniref:hypothetical protein n=1 Tax=Deinococcus radiodurans TaxID=1299 RepID=UPI001FB62FE8|nr:hypothetical protein [Deinococcus radiodurans]